MSKHPKTLLKAYRLFLTGSEDKDIVAAGVSDKQLSQIRQFDSEISSGVPFITVCIALNIDKTIAKRMWKMYYDHLDGKSILFGVERPRVRTVFKMLLNGLTHDELIERGYSEQEINKAHECLQLAKISDTMLMYTMAEKLDLPKSSVANMLKFYRDKKAEMNKDMVQITV